MKQKSASKTDAIQHGWRGSIFALGTALCFSSSSIFIRRGLNGLESPLLGVTVGMIVCVLAYGVILVWRSRRIGTSHEKTSLSRNTLNLQLLAGILVGLSTWARWVALESAPVPIVIALGRLSIPVVLILAPFLIGRSLEQVTPRIWFGAGLILVGSMILTFYD